MLASRELVQRWPGVLGEPVVEAGEMPCGATAVAGSEGAVAVVDAAGSVVRVTRVDDAIQCAAMSPDGTRLLVGGMSGAHLLDLSTLQQLLMGAERAGWCASAAWQPDSHRVAYATGRSMAVAHRDGEMQWSSDDLLSTVASIVCLRDGVRYASAAYQGVTVFKVGQDVPAAVLHSGGAITSLAASPNGRWVVGGSQEAALHGWKVPDGDEFAMHGYPRAVTALTFDASGRWLACNGGPVGTCWDFAGKGPMGRAALLLTGHDVAISRLAWLQQTSPGPRLATIDVDGRLLTWQVYGSEAVSGRELKPVSDVQIDDDVTAFRATATGVVLGTRSGDLVKVAIR